MKEDDFLILFFEIWFVDNPDPSARYTYDVIPRTIIQLSKSLSQGKRFQQVVNRNPKVTKILCVTGYDAIVGNINRE